MARKTPQLTTNERAVRTAQAKAIILELERLMTEADLPAKSTVQQKRRMLGAYTVPGKLIEEVAATSDQHGRLIGIEFDSRAARDAIALEIAFEPVATKAEAFALRVRETILAAKVNAGSAALAAYASMKGAVRRPQGAVLRDSFEKMTQIMKQRRRGSGAKAARAAAKRALEGTAAGDAPAAAKRATAKTRARKAR